MPFRHHNKVFVTHMPQVRAPVSKSGAVQTVCASNCIKSTCSVNLLTYLPMSAGWVAFSYPAVKAVRVSYSSIIVWPFHFCLSSVSERMCALTLRKNHGSMIWQISCPVSIFLLNLALMLDHKSTQRHWVPQESRWHNLLSSRKCYYWE